MMKRILMMFLMILGISLAACAQTYTYKTTAYVQKTYSYYTHTWSDWYDSNMYMTIDFTNDVVTIYSPKNQIYRIYEYLSNYTDNSGGQQAKFRFIDQDGDKGEMRLRIERNGNSQVYIDFADVMWVYNVVRV